MSPPAMASTTTKRTSSAVSQPSLAERSRRILERWRADPPTWCAEALGEPAIDLQDPMLQFLADPHGRRMAVASANSIGKTNAMAKAMLFWISTRRSMVVTTAPTWALLKQKLWAESARLYRNSTLPLGGVFLADSLRWKVEPKWEAYGLVPRDESSFQGEHAPSVLVIFDEAQGVDAKFWTAAEGMMASEHAKWLVVGNPLQPKGQFYAAFRKPHLWRSHHISALEHPNVVEKRLVIPGAVTHQWVEEMREDWGEEDPRYIARVLGQFPVAGSDRVIPLPFLELADAAFAESLADPSPMEGPHLGVDVARFGDDETVVAIVVDGIAVEERCMAALDGPAVANAVIRIADEYGIDRDDAGTRIHVDEIGIGASVVDALAVKDWHCDAVNFAAKPRGDWPDLTKSMEFRNLRAELYWVTRERLRRKTLVIPAVHGLTWEELTEPGFSYPQGLLTVESKEDIKRRLQRSPDRADAVVLAQARQSRRGPRVIVL